MCSHIYTPIPAGNFNFSSNFVLVLLKMDRRKQGQSKYRIQCLGNKEPYYGGKKSTRSLIMTLIFIGLSSITLVTDYPAVTIPLFIQYVSLCSVCALLWTTVDRHKVQ